MNKLNLTSPLKILIALIISAMSISAKASGTLQGVDFKVCSSSKCLHIQSPKAWGSQLKPLYLMKDVYVTVMDLKAHKQETSLAERAHFDFQTNEVVVSQIKHGKKIERVFQLDTLTEKQLTVN